MIAATVAGEDIPITEVDIREAELRTSGLAGVLPVAGTSEGRQLRRWLTQLLVTERVIAVEAAARRIEAADAPGEHELLPDATARLELGSVTSAVLTSSAMARALFAQVTAHVDVTEPEIAGYHARNPYRYAARRRATDGATATGHATATGPATATATATGHAADAGWDTPPGEPPPLSRVRDAVAADLRAAARRRAFAAWLDGRKAELVRLAPGFEHPGDPRQPDNTHKH
jgi:[acyl-carrier-protein] S-malonyltransferase